jgi:hypothetical protein
MKHWRKTMWKSNLMRIIVCSIIAAELYSCSGRQRASLKVESEDSTRAVAPFLLAYVSDDGAFTPGPSLAQKQTPFEMELDGENYLIVLGDTSLAGPNLRAWIRSSGTGGAGITFRRGGVFFKGGKDGVGVGSFRPQM